MSALIRVACFESVATPRCDACIATPTTLRYKTTYALCEVANVCNENLLTILIDSHRTRDTLPRAQSTEGEGR